MVEIAVLLQFPLICLSKLGFLSSNGTSKIALVVMVFMIMLTIFYELLSLFQIIFLEGNVFNFVDNVEALAAFFQMSGKIIFMMYTRKQMIKLIELSKHFWKSNICSKITETEVNSITRSIYYFQRFLICSYFIAAIFMCLTTVFFGRTLPIGTWQIKNEPELNLLAIILMSLLLAFLGVFLSGFDNLYLGFCFEMVAQFRIFCDQVEHLDVETINSTNDLKTHYNKLKIMIKQHKFLLSYLSDLRSMYSATLMIEYVGIVPTMCVELYAVTQNTDTAIIIRCSLAVVCQTVQLGLYCLSADFVSNEASKTAAAIYNSNWYSNYFKILRTPTQLFLQAAQQDVEFNACGIIKINSNTMVHVFRVIMSANAILRSLNN